MTFTQLEQLQFMLQVWYQFYSPCDSHHLHPHVSNQEVQWHKCFRWGSFILALSEITEVWGTCLNSTSCVCLATDVQRKPDSVAPKTGQRWMICDSFNEPGYEQSSCSPYISRNSCCFSRVFDFILFFILWLEGRGDSHHTKTAWTTLVWRAGKNSW